MTCNELNKVQVQVQVKFDNSKLIPRSSLLFGGGALAHISEQRLVTEPSPKARQSEMMRERRFRKSEHARGLLAPAWRKCKGVNFFRNEQSEVNSVERVSIFPLYCRAFLLTWPASACANLLEHKESVVHTNRVQLSQDWFETPTWLQFHCFGTPICMAAMTSCENAL